jgi:hypothetical protein
VKKQATGLLLWLNDFLNKLGSQISDDVLSGIVEHLQDLQVTVNEVFPAVVVIEWL